MTSVEGKEREDWVQVEVCEGGRERERGRKREGRRGFRISLEILLAYVIQLNFDTSRINNHHTTGNKALLEINCTLSKLTLD